MKLSKLFIICIALVFTQCSHPGSNTIREILSKDKVNVKFISFFNKRNNREVKNLDATVEVTIPKKVTVGLKANDAAVKYDKEGEKRTISDLNDYLKTLDQYTRYIFGFTLDSIRCTVYTTESFDVIRTVTLDKKNNKIHRINESFFVTGTLLKIVDTDISGKDGDFSEPVKEKVTTCLFDENKMFYKTEEKKNGAEHVLKLNNDAAFLQMQDAILFKQFCGDAALRLKDKNPELFEPAPEVNE